MSFTSSAAIAQIDAQEVPGNLIIATRLAEDCILSPGFERPWSLLELALVISPDGTAARLIPTFLKAVSFDDGKGKTETIATRKVALTYSLTKPEGNTTIFRDALVLGEMNVNGSGLKLNGSDRLAAFTRQLLSTHLPSPAWRTFSGVSFEVEPKKNPLLQAIQKGLWTDDVNPATPLNLTIEMAVTEEASGIAKFLSDFAQEEELTTLIRNQLIDDLDLRSEEEVKAATVKSYTDRRNLVIKYRDAYITRYPKEDNRPDEYQENLEEYEAEIDRLDLLLLELDGKDPLGIFTSAE